MELNCNLCRFRVSTAPDIYQGIYGFKDLIQLQFDPCSSHKFQFSEYEFSNVFVCLKEFERDILELPPTKSHGIYRTIELLAERKTGHAEIPENNRDDNDDYYDTELVYGSDQPLDIRLLLMKVRKINIANRLHQEKLFQGNASIQTLVNRSLFEVYLERKRRELNSKLSKLLQEDSFRERSWNEPEILMLCKFGLTENNSKFIRSLNSWYSKRLYEVPPPLEPAPSSSSEISLVHQPLVVSRKRKQEIEVPDVPILTPPSIHQPVVKRKKQEEEEIKEDDSKMNKLIEIYEHCRQYEDLQRIAIEFHDSGEKIKFLRDLLPGLISRTQNFTKGLQELAHLIEEEGT